MRLPEQYGVNAGSNRGGQNINKGTKRMKNVMFCPLQKYFPCGKVLLYTTNNILKGGQHERN